eukprot:gene1541-2563_t
MLGGGARRRLAPLLLAAGAARGRAAVPVAASMRTFGTAGHRLASTGGNRRGHALAVKGATLARGEVRTVFEHAAAGGGVVTEQWFTGQAIDNTTAVHVWVDGERRPSIVANLFLWHGVDWRENDPAAATPPWSTRRFSNLGKAGGLSNTVRIPFGRSVRIAVSGRILRAPAGSNASSLWYIVRGVEALPVVLGDLQLPPPARLRLYAREDVVVGTQCFLTMAATPAPRHGGALFHVTMFAHKPHWVDMNA